MALDFPSGWWAGHTGGGGAGFWEREWVGQRPWAQEGGGRDDHGHPGEEFPGGAWVGDPRGMTCGHERARTGPPGERLRVADRGDGFKAVLQVVERSL